MDKKTFKAIDEETGKEIEYEIILTFDSDETKKSYVVYTDNEKDGDGIKVYASTYEEDGDELIINPIETDDEWDMVQTIIDSINEDIK